MTTKQQMGAGRAMSGPTAEEDAARREQLQKRSLEIAATVAERRERWERENAEAMRSDPYRFNKEAYNPCRPEEAEERKALAREIAEIADRDWRRKYPDSYAAMDAVRARYTDEEIGPWHPRDERMVEVDERLNVTEKRMVACSRKLGAVTSDSPADLPRHIYVTVSASGTVRRTHHLALQWREWNSLDAYLAYLRKRRSGGAGLTGQDVREELASYAHRYGDEAVRDVLRRVGLQSTGQIRKQHYRAVFDACDTPPESEAGG